MNINSQWITVSEIIELMLEKDWELARVGSFYHLRKKDKHDMRTPNFELTFDEVREIRLRTEGAKEGLCAMH